MKIKFLTVSKKRLASQLKYFRNYIPRKMPLLKCLKGQFSEHRSEVNLATGPKHCLNLHDGTFILLFHHYEIV